MSTNDAKNLATHPFVAHQGGWDEALLVLMPLLVVGGLLWLANRRLAQRLENETRPEVETSTEVDIEVETGAGAGAGAGAEARAGAEADVEIGPKAETGTRPKAGSGLEVDVESAPKVKTRTAVNIGTGVDGRTATGTGPEHAAEVGLDKAQIGSKLEDEREQ